MFSLDRHIEILLLKNDCVIVPGFGGFVARHVSARIDEEDRTVLPPKVMVGFNQQLTMNDSLLVQSYIETYDYSYPEALRVLDDEVAQLRDMIQEYGYFDIQSVGRLTVNKRGNYEFEPAVAGILSPSLYGLSGVATTDSEAFITSKDAAERRRIENYNSYTANDNGNDFIRISVSALRRGMVACIVILLLMVVPFLNRSTNTRQLISGIDTSLLSDLVYGNTKSTDTPAQKVTPYINRDKETPSPEAVSDKQIKVSEDKSSVSGNAEDALPAKSEQAQSQEQEVFTVVLAARITKENAEAYVADLHQRGKTSARVVGEGKSRKVVYGSFSSKEEAQIVKSELSANSEFEYAWVTKL